MFLIDDKPYYVTTDRDFEDLIRDKIGSEATDWFIERLGDVDAICNEFNDLLDNYNDLKREIKSSSSDIE
jgi:hypothetical protein